jgi:hypothetical protein
MKNILLHFGGVIMAFLFLTPSQGLAQTCDTIYLVNGRVIAAEIQDTRKTDISYNYCGDATKRPLLAEKKDLLKIKYRTNEIKVFQEPTVGASNKWHIETTDGNDFVGEMIGEDAEKILFKSETVGVISIPRQKVKMSQPVASEQYVNGEYWFRNPHDTRYYFGPNAYGIRKGEGYYQNTWIFYNQVTYAFTDNISAGVGVVPLFLFAGTSSPVWITPKISVPVVKNKFNIGVGAFMGTVLGESGSGFGIVYGVATVGPRDKNASLGIGYGYFGGEFATEPAISLSFMSRVGKKVVFITENYSIKTDEERAFLLSAGIRFLGKKLAIDASLIMPLFPDQDFFFAFPWLGITVPFGNPAVQVKGPGK